MFLPPVLSELSSDVCCLNVMDILTMGSCREKCTKINNCIQLRSFVHQSVLTNGVELSIDSQ